MAEVAAKQRKHKMSRLEKKNTLIAYSFLAPNFLGFAIFTLVPVVLRNPAGVRGVERR